MNSVFRLEIEKKIDEFEDIVRMNMIINQEDKIKKKIMKEIQNKKLLEWQKEVD